MRLSLSRESLLKPLERISGISVSSGGQKPILANVLLYVYPNPDPNGEIKDAPYILQMTCTDGELEMSTKLGVFAPDTQIGATTVSVKKLVDILKALPTSVNVDFDLVGNNLAISTFKTKARLTTLPAEQFPNIDCMGNLYDVVLEGKELSTLIKVTEFSITVDNYRNFLRGMKFEFSGNDLFIYGADGHRLNIYHGKTMEPVVIPPEVYGNGFIFPKKGVSEVRKLLSYSEKDNNGNEQDVVLSVGPNSIKTTISGVTLISKLIDAKYPNVNNIVPLNCSRVITLDREYFKEVLRRAAILCNNKNNAVCFDVTNEHLTIKSTNSQHEQSEENVEAICECNGENFEIAFNVQYIIDVCNVLTTPQIKLSLSKVSNNVKIEAVFDQKEKNADFERELNALFIISRFQI